MADVKGIHRVLALLLGPETDKPSTQLVIRQNRSVRARSQSRKRRPPLEIRDSKTLLVNCFDEETVLPPQNGSWTFDYVGFASTPRANSEVFSLVDHLFTSHRNACLMILKGKLSTSPNVLAEVIVDEVSKRVQACHGCFISIDLAYFYARDDGTLNLPQTKRFERNWPQISCKTAEDACKWLRNVCGTVDRHMHTHECFDYQFNYYDTKKRIYKLKLSVVQLYVYRMVENDRLIIGQILENISNPMEGSIDEIKAQMLLGCVKDYFSDKWCTCVTFEIPTLPEELNMTKEMMRLADCCLAGLYPMRARSRCRQKTPRRQSARTGKGGKGTGN